VAESSNPSKTSSIRPAILTQFTQASNKIQILQISWLPVSPEGHHNYHIQTQLDKPTKQHQYYCSFGSDHGNTNP